MIMRSEVVDSNTAGASGPLTFKVATEEWEFEQIHRLNYETFVVEIRQHEPNQDGLLVDEFHHENTYFICVRGEELMGMVAARDRRPFSLDQKLDHLDKCLPTGKSICEIRLLSIKQEHRRGMVLTGLLITLARQWIRRRHNFRQYTAGANV